MAILRLFALRIHRPPGLYGPVAFFGQLKSVSCLPAEVDSSSDRFPKTSPLLFAKRRAYKTVA
jgi:hypothetical protein